MATPDLDAQLSQAEAQILRAIDDVRRLKTLLDLERGLRRSSGPAEPVASATCTSAHERHTADRSPRRASGPTGTAPNS